MYTFKTTPTADFERVSTDMEFLQNLKIGYEHIYLLIENGENKQFPAYIIGLYNDEFAEKEGTYIHYKDKSGLSVSRLLKNIMIFDKSRQLFANSFYLDGGNVFNSYDDLKIHYSSIPEPLVIKTIEKFKSFMF